MAGREIDSKSGEFYWRQTELLRRFEGVESDLKKAAQAYLHSIQGKQPLFQKAYTEGFEDAVKEFSWILTQRFNELARILERERREER